MVPMAEHYPPEYLEFVRLFNEGKYAESHRVLHDIWSENRSNYFYKALIQMAGAHQHWQEQSYYWAADLFRGAAQLLSAYAPRHGGLDINELVRTLQTCADVADAQRNDRQGAYKLPPVKLTV
ncbi:MAG: hypothetical protein DIU83_05715 [Bacillota bacterium]|jgi:Uncharacterized conserved protein|nr:MAG: hypothetical protein DIU83_05715 [Bacillota bacterium]